MKDNSAIKNLIQELESDLMNQIIHNTEKGILSDQDAQELAQAFIPITYLEERGAILNSMKNLGARYKEAQEVYIKYNNLYSQEEKTKVLEKVHLHLLVNDIDSAIRVIQDGDKA